MNSNVMKSALGPNSFPTVVAGHAPGRQYRVTYMRVSMPDPAVLDPVTEFHITFVYWRTCMSARCNSQLYTL